MTASQYRIIGWVIFGGCILLAIHWCLSQSGLAGFLMERSEAATGKRLTQLSWLITLAVVGLPGYFIRNYFEGLAWDAHVKTLPPPNRSESARRSKYVQTDGTPAAPAKPVTVAELPKGQQEFIATCPACGNFFSAKAEADLKCPHCGEPVPS